MKKIIPVFLSVFSFYFTNAQLVGGEAFMQNPVVEVGISACGSFGTANTPPAGYHPNPATGGLGFVADPDQDGWTVGTPPYMGDYFLPGTPLEGFGIQWLGAGPFFNSNDGSICGDNDIPGSITAFTATATETCATWNGTISGVDITLETCLPTDSSMYFVTEVTVCNTTGQDIYDFYFMRQVDPDNEQTNSGSFTTENQKLFTTRFYNM